MKAMAVFLLLLAPVANAQWWDSQRGPGGPSEKAAGYTRVHIDRAKFEVQRAFAAGDIDKLERMHDEFLALEKAGGAGRYMMSSFGDPIGRAPVSAGKVVETFDRWKVQRPDSALRVIFEAQRWFDSAWRHRGSGYANNVSPEAMALFRADLDRAARVLQQAGPSARGTPLYYAKTIAVAGSLGQPREVLDAIFAEGVAKFPIDWGIHRTRLNFLLPQWDGTLEEMDRFMLESVPRTQASEGTGMYARLWTSVVRSLPEESDFFEQTGVKWPVLRHSFEDALALESDSSLRNYYATFACMAKDVDTLRRQARLLGRFADYGGVGRLVSSDACAEMASGEP